MYDKKTVQDFFAKKFIFQKLFKIFCSKMLSKKVVQEFFVWLKNCTRFLESKMYEKLF